MSIKDELIHKKNARDEIALALKNIVAEVKELVNGRSQSVEVCRVLSMQIDLTAALDEYFVADIKLDKEVERIFTSKILS